MIAFFLASAFLVLAPATSSPAAASQPATNSFQPAEAITQNSSRDDVCYKMRTYIFARNDGEAPKFVRETTCPPSKPRLNRSRLPKARMIPAN